MKHRASIIISFEKLARILNLKPDLQVTGADVNLSAETLRIFIKGESLPPHRRKCESINIPLTQLMDVDDTFL